MRSTSEARVEFNDVLEEFVSIYKRWNYRNFEFEININDLPIIDQQKLASLLFESYGCEFSFIYDSEKLDQLSKNIIDLLNNEEINFSCELKDHILNHYKEEIQERLSQKLQYVIQLGTQERGGYIECKQTGELLRRAV